MMSSATLSICKKKSEHIHNEKVENIDERTGHEIEHAARFRSQHSSS